jgi:hypothetical protein
MPDEETRWLCPSCMEIYQPRDRDGTQRLPTEGGLGLRLPGRDLVVHEDWKTLAYPVAEKHEIPVGSDSLTRMEPFP